MKGTLNITNGDCAVEVMREAGIAGDILPWRDVLHDGPVPEGLSLEALSVVRARFIAERGWGEEIAVHADFMERDARLKDYSDYEKVCLWFEHDLYDQLQLLQILDWFASQAPGPTALTMICTDRYLGMLSSEQLRSLSTEEQPVSETQLALARRAWAAFCAPTPEPWAALLTCDTGALPFLHDAVMRQIEEYPCCTTGLSRTARQALEIIARGEHSPSKVFALYQDTEDRRFMGDNSFWSVLNELLDGEPPLLTLSGAERLERPIAAELTLSLTTRGREVLAGTRRWLDTHTPERWIGGVHLDDSNLWCRDPQAQLRRMRVH